MYILDRYLYRLFAKVLLVAFLSLTGLYIVIDGFGNATEFIDYGDRLGGVIPVLARYYGARTLWFFDRTSGLMALVAGVFAITWLQRSNELTALMAAGIPRARVARPLIAACILVSLLAAANREVGIPRVRGLLTRNAQNWLGERPVSFQSQQDKDSHFLISGLAAVRAERLIQQPHLRVPRPWRAYGRKLKGETAVYHEATTERPAGYWLHGVKQAEILQRLPSVRRQERTILYCPSDTAWLQPDECFLVSRVDFDRLTEGRQHDQFSSTGELVRRLHNPSLDYGAPTRVTVHVRLVQPILDVTLFLIGIPLVLRRRSHNVFLAGALCLVVVSGFFLVGTVCQAMGNSALISAALAAWLPLFVFVPWAWQSALGGWE